MSQTESGHEEPAKAKPAPLAAEGKYLTFVLGGEEYGIDIVRVKEIIGVMGITHIPMAPDFVKGVINLRGKVIPVMDLRLKFGMPELPHTRETVFIVVEVNGGLVGTVVDTVREVLNIGGKDIEPPPQFGARLDTSFILGMGKAQGKVKILLDIERALTAEEKVILSDLLKDETAEATAKAA